MLENKGKWFEEFLKCDSYKLNAIVSNDMQTSLEIAKEIIKIIDSKVLLKSSHSYGTSFKLVNGMHFEIIQPTDRSKGFRFNRIFTYGDINNNIKNMVLRTLLFSCEDGIDSIYYEL